MTYDIILVLGLVFGILAVPSFLSAFSESRPPRLAAILALVAAALIATAVMRHPGGYSIAGLPEVFARVIAHLLR